VKQLYLFYYYTTVYESTGIKTRRKNKELKDCITEKRFIWVKRSKTTAKDKKIGNHGKARKCTEKKQKTKDLKDFF